MTFNNCALFLFFFVFACASYADTAVIVNPGNTANIDTDYVKKIYTGKITEFPDGQLVNAINLSQSNDTRTAFDEKFLQRQTSQVQALWSKLVFTGKGTPPKEVGSSEEVMALVASDKSAIGYIDFDKADSTVKVILKL